MNDESPRRSGSNRRQLRRTVAVLALTAAAIYLGFIARAVIA